jgi:hypothetical protein
MILTAIKEIIEKINTLIILPIILSIILKQKPLHVLRKKGPLLILVLFAVMLIVVSVILPAPPQTSPGTKKPPGKEEQSIVEEQSPPDIFYNVVYMKNEAKGKEPVSGRARAGSDITIKSGDTLSKWRSVFAGWKSDTGTHYNAGDTINNISENITLIAQWKPVQFRDETKKIMTGETHSFFSGEVQLHFTRTETKNASPPEAIPVYVYVVDGWVSAGGERKLLTEFKEGSTDVFSEAFDITVTHIQQYNAEFTVRKYTP